MLSQHYQTDAARTLQLSSPSPTKTLHPRLQDSEYDAIVSYFIHGRGTLCVLLRLLSVDFALVKREIFQTVLN